MSSDRFIKQQTLDLMQLNLAQLPLNTVCLEETNTVNKCYNCIIFVAAELETSNNERSETANFKLYDAL